jgi:hypothetical protein
MIANMRALNNQYIFECYIKPQVTSICGFFL